MTPWLLFLYTLSLTGGLTIATLVAGVLRFAWMVLIGWVMNVPKGAGEQ